MANEYLTPAEIKLKRKRKATRIAMYGAIAGWIITSNVALAILYRAVFGINAIVSMPKNGSAIAFNLLSLFFVSLVAYIIGALFRAKIERKDMELKRMMNVL